MQHESYSKEGLETRYQHHYHAGNIADVWKHIVWLKLVRGYQKMFPAITVLDCHAGLGQYDLQSTGEWQEGIGKLSSIDIKAAPDSLAFYLSAVRDFRTSKGISSYPGSPRLFTTILRETDNLQLFEREESTFIKLQENIEASDRIKFFHQDCCEMLSDLSSRSSNNSEEIFLLDPDWSAKREWRDMAQLISSIYGAVSNVKLSLWYPIKSYTRVNEMYSTFRTAGMHGLALELITTPLRYQRNRLNGSGVLVLNPPPGLAVDTGQAAPFLAQHTAVMPGEWEFKIFSF